jgi:hypothetical protein
MAKNRMTFSLAMFLISILSLGYLLFSFFGFSRRNLHILVLVYFLNLVFYGMFRWVSKDPKENFPKFCLIFGSIAVTLMSMDLLVFNKFIRIGQPVDLSVIPLHSRIVTREGFSTGTMEANFQKRAFTSGQMSKYVEDTGFYEPRWISVETDELGLRNSKGQSQEI